MLNQTIGATECYLSNNGKSVRKRIGQFFTSMDTAQFMAGLFFIPNQKSISILDPGAGTGILSAALIERLQGFLHCVAVHYFSKHGDGFINRRSCEATVSSIKGLCKETHQRRVCLRAALRFSPHTFRRRH